MSVVQVQGGEGGDGGKGGQSREGRMVDRPGVAKATVHLLERSHVPCLGKQLYTHGRLTLPLGPETEHRFDHFRYRQLEAVTRLRRTFSYLNTLMLSP
mgnify:CR=1 FL=1